MRPVLSIIMLMLVFAAAHAGSKLCYQFVTPDGETVIMDSLPPEQAKYGYEVRDCETNRLIRRVAPQLSDEEAEAERERKRLLEECERELARLRSKYTSVEDILAARDREFRLIDEESTNRHDDLARARYELNRLEQNAAADERAGRTVPKKTRKSITRLNSRISVMEARIEQQGNERNAAAERYQHEAERFRDGTCPEPAEESAELRLAPP